MPLDDLLFALKEHEPEMIAIRRDIHQHPEMGFEEARTSAIVAAKLREWGLEVTEGIAKTGVVGVLKGKRGGNRSIGLRADMDALYITETPGRSYESATKGKMHACGHDGHTAMLLSAAKYLSKHTEEFGGTVTFIFQPAEEGLGGAREMVKEGLFDRFPVDAVYGMHNMPGIPVGHFSTRPGPFLAASDSWSVTFHGTGGHGGAGAHLATDPTLAMAQFIMAMQTIVSRNVRASDTAVVSVGSVSGGDPGAPNIIPSRVTVIGTARSYKPKIRDLIETRLKELGQTTAAVFGCAADVVYTRRYPPTVNHEEQTAIAVSVAASLVGEANVESNSPALTGAEDFAFMLQAKPGSFIMIGNGDSATGKHQLHTPGYDFNDEILSLGSAYWVQMVRTELGTT